MQERDRRPDPPTRRAVLRAGLSAGVGLLGVGAASRAAARSVDEWRAAVGVLQGRFRGAGFEQRIAIEPDGFAIHQIAPPDIVEQKSWPSMRYSRVGRANFFSGVPADRLIVDHEVWFARMQADGALIVEAHFFDRFGARMDLVSRRRLSPDGRALLWRVDLNRAGTPILAEELRLEKR
ncbi:MAG: hypothetical protein RIB45_11295 [Marivibrio sp.]|uniref:hypothetical protein n=1 Tax=Marivibrio sp. TaxID=2039719 RepID=UPI0032EEB17F